MRGFKNFKGSDASGPSMYSYSMVLSFFSYNIHLFLTYSTCVVRFYYQTFDEKTSCLKESLKYFTRGNLLFPKQVRSLFDVYTVLSFALSLEHTGVSKRWVVISIPPDFCIHKHDQNSERSILAM